MLLIPAIAAILTFSLFRTGRTAHPPGGALIRASVLIMVIAFFLVELLSIPSALTASTLSGAWAVVSIGIGAVLLRRHIRYGGRITWDRIRHRPRPSGERATRALSSITPVERLCLVVIVLLVLGEFVFGLITIPSTQDSLTYHLPRIEHWWRNQSVAPYPSQSYRQITLAPGAEFLQLTVRLLTGTVWLAPLAQWLAGIGTTAAVYRITGQLGGGRRASAVAAALAATTPMLIVQASGTVNDLIAALALAAFVSLVLESHAGEKGCGFAAITGTALGVAVLSKNTVIPLAAGFALWWAWSSLRRGMPGFREAAVATTMVGVITLPYFAVITSIWGSPFGPPVLGAVRIGAHDPITVAMNVTKITAAELLTPTVIGQTAVCSVVQMAHDIVGRAVSDHRTEYLANAFTCEFRLDEDYVSSPIQVAVALVAAGILMIRGDARQRTYVTALTLSWLAFVGYVSYQPWICRLLVGLVVLGCPLIPLAVRRLALVRGRPGTTQRPHHHRFFRSAGGVTAIAVIAFAAATLVTGTGRPFGMPAITPRQELATRFLRNNPHLVRAIGDIRASNARVVGIDGGEETPEFAIWVLLGADRGEREVVPMRSEIPGYPAGLQAYPNVDAILCVRPAKCEYATYENTSRPEFGGVLRRPVYGGLRRRGRG